MPWKKEIEEGSAVEVSTPTAGARVAVDPARSAPTSSWSAVGALHRPHLFAAARGRRSPRRGRRSCRSRARRGGCARGRAGCRRRTIWRPTPVPKAVSVSGFSRDVGEAGLREVAGEAAAGRPARARRRPRPAAPRSARARPRSSRRHRRAGRRARRSADPLARRAGRGPAPGRRGRRIRSERPSSPLSSSARSRASWRLPVRLCSRFLRVLVSVSPPNSAPIRMPIASARKTAISETAW